MNDELSLFGAAEPVAPVVAATETPIAGWQIDLLRKVLTERGHTTMAERQQVISTAAGRPVESLRSLTHREALEVTDRLATPQERTSSSWEAREDSTWIDNL